MTRKILFIFIPALALALAIGIGIGMKLSSQQGIPVRSVADYINAILQAHRTFYTQHIVERMEAMLLVTATENWKEDHTLPLPAQFFKEASRGLPIRGNPFRYRLISLWPINEENTPQNDQERTALEKVMKYGEVVEQEVYMDDRQFYQAIFPDRAISRACVTCHNSHESSPKRDFKLNDIMGGLAILIPLDYYPLSIRPSIIPFLILTTPRKSLAPEGGLSQTNFRGPPPPDPEQLSRGIA